MNRLSILTLLSCLLLCCSKESNTIASGDFNASLTAELPEMQMLGGPELDGQDTKATTQYTVRIRWAAGDKLSVINLTTGKVLGGNLTANQSGTITSFSGSLNGTVRDGDAIAYFYPAFSNTTETTFNGTSIDMSTQTGTTGGVPLCVYCVSTANSNSFTNASLTFSYLMCYFMIGLSDIPSSTQIKSLTLTNVTNSFDLSINSSKNGFDINTHTGNIVLQPSQTASAAGVRTVYAAIPGSNAVSARQAVLQTSTTSFSTFFAAAKLNNGYAYNTNVTGFLVDDLIPEDKSVREYCLAHFDTNGDGKLTMVEIAGVTKFPDQSQYPLPDDIIRFNELEYFYSLTELPSFKNKRKLESVTIPRQITAIPDEMFYGCATLNKVFLKPMEPPVLGNNVFYGLSGNIILVVADDVVSDYQVAEGWINYFNNFRTESSQNDSTLDIDTEDENDMGNERITIILK